MPTKRIFYWFLAVALSALAPACRQKPVPQSPPAAPPPAGPAKAEWTERLADLGDIAFGNFASHDFTVRNTGGEPLYLRDVKITCKCLKADWTREPIPPGGSGSVRVTFEAEREGEFYRVVPVSTSVDSVGKATGLIVKGKVIPK